MVINPEDNTGENQNKRDVDGGNRLCSSGATPCLTHRRACTP